MPLPKALKPAEESYARLLATTDKTQHDAYLETHPKARSWKGGSIDTEASKLATKLSPRIAELQASVRRDTEITVKSVADELQRASEVAEKHGQGGAMTQAAMGKAKLAGLLVERHIDETERSKSDADLARDISSVAPEEHRDEVERIVVALLAGNPTPLVSVLDRLRPKAA